MLVYRYYCIDNPPLFDSVPKGYVGIKVWGSRPYVPEAATHVMGTVDYLFPLTDRTMNTYGLRPANVEQRPIFNEHAC